MIHGQLQHIELKRLHVLKLFNLFLCHRGSSPDIAHNVFEVLTVDVISDVLHVLVGEECLGLQKVNIRTSPI